MRRGFTYAELLVGMGLMALLVLGSMTMFASSLKSLKRTDKDVTMSDQSSRALRKITETIRQSVTVTVSDGGRKVTYYLPVMSGAADSVTGESEIVNPPTSDGIARTYTVNFTTGTIFDESGKVIVRNVAGKDNNRASSLYGSSYEPFTIGTIGTRKALTINIITRDDAGGQTRNMRMKTTAIIRNAQ